jgi:hypothetical protein
MMSDDWREVWPAHADEIEEAVHQGAELVEEAVTSLGATTADAKVIADARTWAVELFRRHMAYLTETGEGGPPEGR